MKLKHVQVDVKKIDMQDTTASLEVLQVKSVFSFFVLFFRPFHHQRRVRECDLDVWYEKLEQVTFPTRTIPISIDFAKSMVAAIKARKKGFDVPHVEVQQLQAAIAEFGNAFVKLSSRSPKVGFCFDCSFVCRV